MNKKPKILLFDIETAPNLAYVWGKWEQNVIDFKNHWYILSFSIKWLEGKSMTKGLCDYKYYEKDKENDKRLVENLWKLFDEADILIAHNGDSFDIKKVNARFSFYGIKPPSPYKTVDTKKVAKKYFSFNSNSLNDLGQYLKLGQKVKTGGFELWKGCMSGDIKAWRLMKKYNKQDVTLLEKVYLHFRPWIKTHPNLGMYTNKIICSTCGSGKIQSRGVHRNKTTEYKRIFCNDCGSWMRIGPNLKVIKPTVSI